MTQKYLDQGLYGSASLTANTTSGNSTLTVTAVASGSIGLGMIVSGTGIPTNTCITALGTGLGGAGTYTMNANATATNTGVSVTGVMSHPAREPVWNSAQDGDGTASGAATPAVVSVDMSSWTFSTSSTVSVMGATAITCTSSATTSSESTTPNAQYSATLTTMIDNLVAAINWHGGTISNRPSSWRQSKVRDTVFARRNGNSLELMTRAGSADWNGLVALAFTNVTGSSSQNWGSGAGGAWGHFVNVNGTCWPSGIAQGGYGVIPNVLIAGLINSGDVINVRSNKTFKRAKYDGVSGNWGGQGSVSQPVIIKFDDSTIWSDGTDPVFTFYDVHNTASNFSVFSGTPPVNVKIIAPSRPGEDYYGLVLDSTANASGGGFSLSNGVDIDGVYVNRHASDNRALISQSYTTSANRARIRNLKFKVETGSLLLSATGSLSGTIDLENVRLINGTRVTAHPGLLTMNNAGGIVEISIRNMTCEGFVTGSQLIATSANWSARKVMLSDVDLGNVTQYGNLVSGSSPAAALDWYTMVSLANTIAGRAMLYDTVPGRVEWNPGRSYPMLNATLPEGGYWSQRCLPATSSSYCNQLHPVAFPPIVKRNTLDEDARTFTLNFCAATALSVTKCNVWARITYIDENGDAVTLNSFDAEASSHTAGTATWHNAAGGSQESGGYVTFDEGGTINLNKYKITLSTPTGKDLAADTDIVCEFFVGLPATTSVDFLFFDPDIGVA